MAIELDILKLSDPLLSTDRITVNNSGLAVVQRVADLDGDLIISQSGIDLPEEFFTRIYRRDVTNPSSESGKHAHKKTEQYIFAAAGSFLLDLDDGEKKQRILMDEHHIGVKIGILLWHVMSSFEPSSVMLVFANSYHDEEDYIREYQDFLEYIRPH